MNKKLYDEEFGPQLPGESGISAVVRRHQSWYRATILGLARWGETPAPKCRPLGSILHPLDADAGLGFVTESAANLYDRRRKEGWGVEPVRCRSYLTSSQNLTLNLLGPLFEDLGWASGVFNQFFPSNNDVVDIRVEYAPSRPSDFLGDRTRIDALLTLRSRDGRSQMLAIEIKLADRWSSRFIDPMSKSYLQAVKSIGSWNPDNVGYKSKSGNQLLRAHLLASLVGRNQGSLLPVQMLLITMGGDIKSHEVALEYGQCLNDSSLLKHVSLEIFINAMRSSANTDSQMRMADDLKIRYADTELSVMP